MKVFRVIEIDLGFIPLSINLNFQTISTKMGLKPIQIYPESYCPKDLFGTFTEDDKWHDGILTSHLRNADENTWLVFIGDVKESWTKPLEKLLDEHIMHLENGEHLVVDPGVKFVFETTSLEEVRFHFLYPDLACPVRFVS